MTCRIDKMTHAEFVFWEAVAVSSSASADVSPEECSRHADLMVIQRRERAAKVVDYYGTGLYMTSEGKESESC